MCLETQLTGETAEPTENTITRLRHTDIPCAYKFHFYYQLITFRLPADRLVTNCKTNLSFSDPTHHLKKKSLVCSSLIIKLNLHIKGECMKERRNEKRRRTFLLRCSIKAAILNLLLWKQVTLISV